MGELLESRSEVKVHAQLAERGARGFAHGAVIHEPRRADEAVERDIFRDRHFREKRQVLPNHRDALGSRERRGGRCDAFAEIVGARAGRGLIDARDDLDERALAAAVLAGEAMHLPTADGERYVVERLHAAEAHRYVFEADRVGGWNGGF